jgi:hypothetical protein
MSIHTTVICVNEKCDECKWIKCDDCEGMTPTTEAYQISEIEIGKTLTPEQFNEVFTPRKIDILCPECYEWRVKEYA